MKYAEKIFDVIFNIYTVSIGIFLLFFFFILAVSEQERENQQIITDEVAYCYSIASVRVETDAGPRCAPAEVLEVIK
jgi:hypothetical protein